MHGGAVIRFTDVSAIPRPMQWTMTFNGKGKLLQGHTFSRAEIGYGKLVQPDCDRGPRQACSPAPRIKASLIK